MVQPNNRVFPVAWISREQYDRFKGQLMKLGDKTKTDITFNFEEQYFDIKGRTAQGTEQVAELIVKELAPVLYRAIDEESLRGTFADLDQASALLKEGMASPYNQEGPGSLSADSDESEEVSDGSDYYSDDSLDYMRGSRKASKGKGKQGKEQKSAVMKKKKNEFHEVFTFAKNVKDPEDILFGPPYDTMSSADYAYIVMQETDTECTPDNRTIQIFGPDAASVKSAAEKFRFLQSSYKRIRRQPNPVPCLHLSVDSEEYGLYFCDLDSYADQSYVALPREFKRPAYILIPSFKDKKTDKYMRPQGLLDSSQVLSSTSTPRQQRSTPTYEELDERFSRASESPYMSPSTSWQSGQFTERTNAPPGQALLWGEQQYTVKHSPPPAPNRGRGRGRGSRQQPLDKPRWGTPPTSAGTAEDFPALGGGSQPAGRGRGSSQRGGGRGGNNNQRGRRVMRLTSQKSSRGSPSPPKSMLMMAREYNMHNIKEALSEGLEAARQFRGEVTLTTKLGKILWRNLPTSTEKPKIWRFMDIKDICMKEHKVKPEFNDVTITREDLLHTTLDSIGSNCGHAFYRSAFFEVHVEGRAKMNEHFKPGVLYIDASGAKCFKVHLHQHVLAEIDWVSLDRKFDFQMNLTVKEMGRAEVSPFKPFMRRVVLRPSDQRRDTNDLSFQEISNGNLLRVKQILHKQVQKFRLSDTVVIQVTRTEIVPRELDTPGRDPKYSAKPGKGPFSYDIEILYVPYEKLFKENLSKPIFQDTKWTVDDVFGDNNRLFSPYIANILSTINHLDTQLSS